jgi:hypothetical protein
MKVIIHGPSLPLLLLAIVLDIPVSKAAARIRKQPADDRGPLEREPHSPELTRIETVNQKHV